MGHLPVIPLCHRVAIKHANTAGNAHAVNVLHVLTFSEKTPTEVFTSLDDNIAGLQPWQALPVDFTEAAMSVAITKLDGVTPTQVFTSTDGGWSGSLSGNYVPEAALGLTLQTAKRGKSYRGRVYLGPLTEGKVDNGEVDSTLVADTAAAWAAWENAMVAYATFTMSFAVASYRHATAEPITNVVGRLGVRTQRKRLTRVRSD